MADTKIFYAITAGEYSDYHIIAITDDKARAEELNRVIPGTNIEEFPSAPVIQSGYWLWQIIRDNSRNSIRVERTSSGIFDFKSLNKVDENGLYTWTAVQAMNEPHALKIAYDLFAQHDAEKAGIT